MIRSLIVQGLRRTSVVAVVSVASASGLLAMPGVVSAGDASKAPPPTEPDPTVPDDFDSQTEPDPTAPDDFATPTLPEPTGNPEGDDDPGQSADPAAPEAAPTGQLPETGVDSTLLVVLGVALTIGGSAIVTLGRRNAAA